MMKHFWVNTDRAEVVFHALLNRFREKGYPFADAEVPQDLVDMTGVSELDQSRYWWHLCYWMRGMVNSNDCAVRLFKFFMSKGGCKYFDPQFAAELSAEEMEKVISQNILSNDSRTRARSWVTNAKHLRDNFSGDPRKLFPDDWSYEKSVTLIINRKGRRTEEYPNFPGFHGFQDKMAGMIAYFLIDRKLITARPYIAAVDFHLLRVMLLTGVIGVSEETLKKPHFRYEDVGLQESGRKAIAQHTEMHPEDMTELADALWLLSRNLCVHSPKNAAPELTRVKNIKLDAHRARKAGVPESEIVFQQPPQMSLGFISEQYNVHGLMENFDREGWLANQESGIKKVCGRCPLHEHCESGIPGSYYYRTGRFRMS